MQIKTMILGTVLGATIFSVSLTRLQDMKHKPHPAPPITKTKPEPLTPPKAVRPFPHHAALQGKSTPRHSLVKQPTKASRKKPYFLVKVGNV